MFCSLKIRCLQNLKIIHMLTKIAFKLFHIRLTNDDIDKLCISKISIVLFVVVVIIIIKLIINSVLTWRRCTWPSVLSTHTPRTAHRQ